MTVRVPPLPFSVDPLIAEAKRRSRQRRALVALCALLLAGLAAGLTLAFRSPGGGGASGGPLAAFKGVGAARHAAQTGGDVLPRRILTGLELANKDAKKSRAPLLLLATTRLLGRTSGGSTVYGLADARGDLCVIDTSGPGRAPLGWDTSCVPPLGRGDPITLDASNGWTAKNGPILNVAGVAMDGVRSVSFTVSGTGLRLTVPVANNVYGLRRQSGASAVQCVAAHFADGSTVNVPVYPCRSGRHGGKTSPGGAAG